ncbi:hypothetical protein DN068_05590 [Taibaiella soli]|uniref:Uncharacterized protein n=1 Tax=Taibaiella soli TaxID=1649169 RepID=A0A2W2AEC3_9BACT|nr:hypothetical protein DN068_05590 [Taibaiella soli]
MVTIDITIKTTQKKKTFVRVNTALRALKKTNHNREKNLRKTSISVVHMKQWLLAICVIWLFYSGNDIHEILSELSICLIAERVTKLFLIR